MAIVIAGVITVGQAGEVEITSRIESVSMFKNGLAFVKRVAEVPGPGTYVLKGVPEPVHGTFWIESDADVITRTTTREFDAPISAGRLGTDFQSDLAGREVVVRLRNSEAGTITGRVVKLMDEDSMTWDRNYTPPSYSSWWGYSRNTDSANARPPVSSFLLLETKSGQMFIDKSQIASLETSDAPLSEKRSAPALVFDVKQAAPSKAKPSAIISISYLAKGIAWAPSYRIDASDSTTLQVRQQAVIRNELEDLQDVELILISGFPSIEFADVASPLSGRTTLATFFSQLAQAGQPRRESNMMTQQAVASNFATPEVDLSAAIPEGEGVDLHFESIGRHSLSVGDSLMLNVASGRAPYQRVVEWIVPDNRDAYGRLMSDYDRANRQSRDEEGAWDALQYRNPLPFAMTTAPAMIVTGGQFKGQHTSFWINRGEQSTLRITKALGLRTQHNENEEGDRQVIHIGGHDYRQTTVRGRVAVNNHRGEAVEIKIRVRFSGELLDAEGDPKSSLLEEGVWSRNQRNELVWSVSIQPGQELQYAYRYKVLTWD